MCRIQGHTSSAKGGFIQAIWGIIYWSVIGVIQGDTVREKPFPGFLHQKAAGTPGNNVLKFNSCWG